MKPEDILAVVYLVFSAFVFFWWRKSVQTKNEDSRRKEQMNLEDSKPEPVDLNKEKEMQAASHEPVFINDLQKRFVVAGYLSPDELFESNLPIVLAQNLFIPYGKYTKRQIQRRLRKHFTDYDKVKESLEFLKTRVRAKRDTGVILVPEKCPVAAKQKALDYFQNVA